MTTVQQVFTIRSFRNAKDRDFAKALQIYDANTHPQTKTDSREITYWLDNTSTRKDGRFFVCGLYCATELVGYVEFIYLPKERLINFDYFIIDPSRRTAGAFHTFSEQMRVFFAEERLEWDFVSAEIAEVDVVNGVSRHAQSLARLFRQVGFSEVVAEYEQPLLGIEHPDTAMKARLLILPRVEMTTLSRTRYLEIVAAIYRKHYGEWYSIYPTTAAQYQSHLDSLLQTAEQRLGDKKEIQLRGPEREFADPDTAQGPPLRDALSYVGKIVLSAIAAAGFQQLLRHGTQFSLPWIVGISSCVFVLLVITISLTDKKRLEAFKLLVSLVSKLFDR